jgi:hypothetical protein
VFAGIVIAKPDPEAGQLKGLDHLGPEDTHEADYGRLLENALVGKGVCARRDLIPTVQVEGVIAASLRKRTLLRIKSNLGCANH